MRLLHLPPQGFYFTAMKVLISSLALLALVGTGELSLQCECVLAKRCDELSQRVKFWWQ